MAESGRQAKRKPSEPEEPWYVQLMRLQIEAPRCIDELLNESHELRERGQVTEALAILEAAEGIANKFVALEEECRPKFLWVSA
jgi:hypothetical protein